MTRALEVLFILHAEHELNCSTAAVRHLASSGVDVYTAMAGGAAALYGPKHGGANEAVLRMLEEIGTKDNIPQFIKDVKDRKKLLMGFGHRVYKNYDPRAKIVKRIAEEVFEITGKEPLIEIAMELEKIALSDEYFIKRKVNNEYLVIPERGLLFWMHLQGAGVPDRHVCDSVCNSQNGGLACTLVRKFN